MQIPFLILVIIGYCIYKHYDNKRIREVHARDAHLEFLRQQEMHDENKRKLEQYKTDSYNEFMKYYNLKKEEAEQRRVYHEQIGKEKELKKREGAYK